MTRIIPTLLGALLTIASYAQQAGPIPGRLLLRLSKEARTADVESALKRALPAAMGEATMKPLGEGGRYHLLLVGIIDSGVDGKHPDLIDNIFSDGSVSFDHGTEVAGMVGVIRAKHFGVGMQYPILVLPDATSTPMAAHGRRNARPSGARAGRCHAS